MWNLDDRNLYMPVVSFEIGRAVTYADMRPGHTDREKREHIRSVALQHLPQPVPQARAWAFRISVYKRGARSFDIENVPKLVIDSFCIRQIQRDNSRFPTVGLFPDDTLDHVTMLQVAGERAPTQDLTKIEVFTRINHEA